MLKGLTILAMLFGMNVSAMDFNFDEELRPPRRDRGCRGLNLTAEQKAQIKAKLQGSRRSGRAMQVALKQAMKAHRQVLLDVSTTREEAVASARTVQSKRRPLRQLKRNTRLDIAFGILTGEQRVKAIKCKKRRQRRRRGGHHGGGHHGGGHH